MTLLCVVERKAPVVLCVSMLFWRIVYAMDVKVWRRRFVSVPTVWEQLPMVRLWRALFVVSVGSTRVVQMALDLQMMFPEYVSCGAGMCVC